VYEELGGIQFLSWLALSFSATVTGLSPICRRLLYIFDLKVLLIASTLLLIAGAAVTGSARTLHAFLVGRVVCGIGGAGTVNWYVVATKAYGNIWFH
jgi:hypothetical protein